MKPDKMEETLTCIICQDLLHDCVRYVSRSNPDDTPLALFSVERGTAVKWTSKAKLSLYLREQRGDSLEPRHEGVKLTRFWRHQFLLTWGNPIPDLQQTGVLY